MDNVHFYFTARRLFGSSCVFYRQTLDFAAEIGDAGAGALKAYVIESVNEFLAPHRERRAELAKDMDSIRDILHDGNARANAIAEETLDQVREAMGMKY